MKNEEIIQLLKDAGITTANTGGLLNTEQSTKFIETTIDQSQFLKDIRTETGIGTARDLDNIGVGTRLLHKPTENVAPADDKIQGVTTGKRTLTPVEVMLPYNISLSYLEENIEKKGVEDTINRLFATQFGNDVSDLFVNGNTSDAGADATFLNIFDGLFVTLAADANKQVYARGASTDWLGTVFPNLLKTLPLKYRSNPAELVIYVSADVELEYREQLATRVGIMGDSFLVTDKRAYFKGIPVEAHPYFVYGECLLTKKKNLAVGFGRDVSVYKQFKPRARRVEYTITAKIDADYVLSELNVYCV